MNKNIWTKIKGLHYIIQETELKECHVNTKKRKKHKCKEEGRQCWELPTTNAESFSQVTKTSVPLPTTAALLKGRGLPCSEGGTALPRSTGPHAWSQLTITPTPPSSAHHHHLPGGSSNSAWHFCTGWWPALNGHPCRCVGFPPFPAPRLSGFY